MDERRIVIVGGGPAGMMAAIRASQFQQDVTLIEKNPTLGKKLLLSGKGRCNLTNACDLDSFLKRFSGNGQFLRDAFKKFFNQDLINFFQKMGLKLKVERQLRVFPVSDRSDSILKVLQKELHERKVKIIYKSAVKDVFMQENKVKGLLLRDGRVIPADRLILATGGVSYSFTGSSGEGLKIAQRLGHHVIPLRPGLVPLETRQKYPRILEGLTLKNIRIKFTTVPIEYTNKSIRQLLRGCNDGQRQIVSEMGELLFTAFGISGPLVLTLSGQIVDWLSQGRGVYAEIDLKPALSCEQLKARVLREFKLNSKKSIGNALNKLLPKRLVNVFIEAAKISPDKKANQVTQEERQRILTLLKGFHLDITQPGPLEEAMVTRGGISLKEINPRTMESLRIKGLYFAGEMIDVDADTGGFNLQAAFSTGYLAGESAALS